MDDSDEAGPKRGRGRPPKLKRCVRCTKEKRRRDYDNGRDDVCSFCKHEIRSAGGPRGVTGADLSPESQYGPPTFPMMKPTVSDPIKDMIRLGAMTAGIKQLFKPVPRCQCCYEDRYVARDGYGGVALLCRRCDYQVRATGCCHLHNSATLYAELYRPEAATSPHEIEALFYAPESERPKYDPAELADADV